MLWERDINDNKLTNNLTVQVKTSSNNKIDNKNSNTNTASTSLSDKINTNNNGGGNRKSVCTVCNNAISKDHIHCVCGRHRNSKITICWWCEPDKAPNTWKNKEEARKHAKPSSNTGNTAALGNTNTTLANLATTRSALLFNGGSNFNMASFGGGNLGFY
ncbi:hypothetical protein QBC32DRAFT_374577 [Pseudoneurospora amorphoporcata]|uniref:Uncharacterized protein n=1 Tax=Pseudoneurospora amorphoporcata TaxID=241081 RepID=A0AAN6NN17_9PEZI|nr:hypothetical protein QBC32DRAFT_374577 [Pseudoneurospora amorphoporcata]